MNLLTNVAVRKLDLATKTWDIIYPSGPAPRPYTPPTRETPTVQFVFASAIIDDYMYVLGSCQFFRLNLERNEWEQLDTTIRTIGHSMAVYKREIIVFGGVIEYVGNRQTSSQLLSYNVDTKEWKALEPNGDYKPPARHQHSATVLNSEMYVIGGINNNNNPLSDFFVYNFVTNSWRTLAPPDVFIRCTPQMQATGGQQILSYEDKIYYVFGNQGGWNILQYYLSHNQWSSRPIGNSGLKHYSATVVGDYLYIIGGSIENFGRQRSVSGNISCLYLINGWGSTIIEQLKGIQVRIKVNLGEVELSS
eukprot:NODE_5835_length_962_cov_2.013111_g5251_i0.p1 GENE.NODE_5835_length_962_cov_2.013111_g5251_i0~~NODE_5835_length_962_cov_2.013111_g5251_i0.p1  ORF type:complete len:316 (-),score=53.93 NODE_5835_length_962_cov_2.013111_g5251_i0:15-932(-)